MNEWPHGYRKLSGPHVCGDALHIDPSSLNIVTGSWRYQDSVQVTDCMHVIHHTFIEMQRYCYAYDCVFAVLLVRFIFSVR